MKTRNCNWNATFGNIDKIKENSEVWLKTWNPGQKEEVLKKMRILTGQEATMKLPNFDQNQSILAVNLEFQLIFGRERGFLTEKKKFPLKLKTFGQNSVA